MCLKLLQNTISETSFLKIHVYRAAVRLGEHNLKEDPDCEETFSGTSTCNETPQDFKIEEVIAHTDYAKPVAFRNDIALIRLDRPVNKTGTYIYEIISLETLIVNPPNLLHILTNSRFPIYFLKISNSLTF